MFRSLHGSWVLHLLHQPRIFPFSLTMSESPDLCGSECLSKYTSFKTGIDWSDLESLGTHEHGNRPLLDAVDGPTKVSGDARPVQHATPVQYVAPKLIVTEVDLKSNNNRHSLLLEALGRYR